MSRTFTFLLLLIAAFGSAQVVVDTRSKFVTFTDTGLVVAKGSFCMKSKVAKMSYNSATKDYIFYGLDGASIDADNLANVVFNGQRVIAAKEAAMLAILMKQLGDTQFTAGGGGGGGAVTFTYDSTTLSRRGVIVTNFPSTQTIDGTVQILNDSSTLSRRSTIVTNFPATQNVTGTVSISQDSTTISRRGVIVTNFPATQTISGTVDVSNFPASQTVNGTVAISNDSTTLSRRGMIVTNFPASQTVNGTVAISNDSTTLSRRGVVVTNFPATQPISGTVGISNDSTTLSRRGVIVTNAISGDVSVNNFPATQPISGTVAATQSGTWNINNVGGTISLPTGAATETTVAALNIKIPSGLTVTGSRLQVELPAGASGLTDAELRATPVPVSGTVSAAQSGTWNITDVTGTVSLPTGAATSALQTTGNTSLDQLDNTVNTNAAAGGTQGLMMMGFDGTNARRILTSSTGIQTIAGAVTVSGVSTAVNQTTQTTALQLLDDVVVTHGAAVLTKSYQIAGTDGTLARQIATNTSGHVKVEDGGNSISIDDNGGSITVDGTVTANIQSSNARGAQSANLLTIGTAHTSNPAAVGDARNVDWMMNSIGVGITKPYAISETEFNYSSGTGGFTNNGTTTVIGTGGAGIKNYITHITICNNGATGSLFTLQDGTGNVLYRTFLKAGAETVSINFTSPPKSAANDTIVVSIGTTGCEIHTNIYGYRAP